MMHIAGKTGEYFDDHVAAGWQFSVKEHSWNGLVDSIQKHIKRLNWGYKVELRTKAVEYINLLGRFKDEHTVECFTDPATVQRTITGENIVIATGGRPHYGNIPGAEDCCISSDDLFSMKDVPQNICVVGASYIGLECAGFLKGLGRDVTVMMRSIFLRGFD
jgi:thioredoxin reductase (NADPH)